MISRTHAFLDEESNDDTLKNPKIHMSGGGGGGGCTEGISGPWTDMHIIIVNL